MSNPGFARPTPATITASSASILNGLRANTRAAGLFGQSGVWAPLIGCVGGATVGEEEGWKIVEVRMDSVRNGREFFKIREDYQHR